MVNIGAKIKTLRAERDLTLDMLVADMKQMYPDIRIDKSMLSRWESGQYDPSLENARYLSMYFNVSLDYLIGLTDVRTPSRLLVKTPASHKKE
jgi:transcriptional regulator with XRE-family HTH domain